MSAQVNASTLRGKKPVGATVILHQIAVILNEVKDLNVTVCTLFRR